MAYDEDLADRLRGALGTTDYEVIKMFGGLAFMVNTHMAVGIIRDELMLRLGRDGLSHGPAVLTRADSSASSGAGTARRRPLRRPTPATRCP